VEGGEAKNEKFTSHLDDGNYFSFTQPLPPLGLHNILDKNHAIISGGGRGKQILRNWKSSFCWAIF
jgi:hypothetical protein